MLNFLLIGICLFAGILCKKFKSLPNDSFKAVNAWVINIALPAVALLYIPEIDWNFSLILPILMPFLVWSGSYLWVNLLGKFIEMNPGTRGALILTSGLGNTSFLGFPLTEAYYGEEGLQIAILCDQASFIVMATFGIITATKASNGGIFDFKPIIRKIFLFPPFIAFVAAFVLPLFITLKPISSLLESLALTLVPLALFSVGLQLKINSWRKDLRLISLALGYKLLLAPALILLTCLILNFGGIIPRVSVFEAAMAPMVTGTILATEYNLNPKLANIILGIGIPVSLISTFIWYLLTLSL